MEQNIQRYKRINASPPKIMSVLSPAPQSHSTLCSIFAELNPSHNFRPYASQLLLNKLLVPDSSKCTLQILEDDYLDYEVSLSPARRKPIDNDDNPEVDLKPIRLADRYVPSVLSDAPEMFSYRGAQIVNLCAKPIQYNSARKTARIHRKISVLVDYGENETVPEMPETCKQDPVLKGMLTSVDTSTNSMMRESYSGKPFFEEKSDYYLIITTDDLIIPASRLSEWRNCTGYETRIVTQRKWTKEQVKSAVRSFYNTYYPNAKYFVILGDTTRVPSYNDIYREKDEDDNYITKVYTYDLEYALITDKRLPDMYYGRIPNNSVDTLCAIVNKIESYEKDKAYFNNRQFIGVAHFQDNATGNGNFKGDGIEDYGFTRSVESVCQTVADKYKTVTRLYGYKEEDKGTPISWIKDTDPSFPFPENFNDYFIEGGWQLWDRPLLLLK